MTKFRSASLKVDRAAKHVAELNELLREKRPFTYVVETNTHACERATFAKKDETVIDEVALICGDAFHGLRSALDHAYWQVVSASVTEARSQRNIQFPFSETATRLEEAVKNRLAHRVSPEFFAFVMDLRPHGETGGNELLYLLHHENARDKHREFIPAADYTRLTGEMIARQLPDFPGGGQFAFGNNHRDIRWEADPAVRDGVPLPGLPGGRYRGVLEQELDVPVDIVFSVGPSGANRPYIPTIHMLVDMTRSIIRTMERFV